MADADTVAMLHHKLRIVDQCIVRVSEHGGLLAVITHLFKTRDELIAMDFPGIARRGLLGAAAKAEEFLDEITGAGQAAA